MATNNYLFFDGSALISQIRTLQENRGEFKNTRLDPLILVRLFVYTAPLNPLIGGSSNYKRAVFYFAEGDPLVDKYIAIPDRTIPSIVRDVEFKYCGRKLPHSTEYDEWLATVPPKFRDRCQKSEKGVDISICCDALGLAALKNLDRLALLTNDSDFIPLCEKLKAFGANISLLKLSSAGDVNKQLVEVCDSYQYFENDNTLGQLFGIA